MHIYHLRYALNASKEKKKKKNQEKTEQCDSRNTLKFIISRLTGAEPYGGSCRQSCLNQNVYCFYIPLFEAQK